MAIQLDSKDPSDVLDYRINWTGELAGDAIDTSEWEATEGTCILGARSVEMVEGETFAKVWVSGGTAGESCVLTNTIGTVGGRTYEQSIVFRVVQK